MGTIKSKQGVLAAALLTGAVALPGAADARTTGQDAGSAIVPTFSVRHAAMRPFEEVTLVLGVHDDNPRASRDVATGDAFHFDFGAGTLGECTIVSVFSSSGAFDAADWSCSVDGQRATLRHDGEAGAWPHGEGVFAEVSYVAPAASTLVGTSHDVGNPGAFAPALPGVIAVGVSADIGSVGPPGPAGPAGPTGPEGPSGEPTTGSVVRATSRRAVSAHRDDAEPIPIPGLEATIELSAGSRLLVLTSVPGHNECPSWGQGGMELQLEVNGSVVERLVRDWDAGALATHAELLWLSEPTGGPQSARVLLANAGGQAVTGCHGAGPDSPFAAHLLLLEIRQ